MSTSSPNISQASVPTAHASRYLQQLCKHWSHNLAVTFSETAGTVTFPRNARGADWPGDATLALQRDEALIDTPGLHHVLVQEPEFLVREPGVIVFIDASIIPKHAEHVGGNRRR